MSAVLAEVREKAQEPKQTAASAEFFQQIAAARQAAREEINKKIAARIATGCEVAQELAQAFQPIVALASDPFTLIAHVLRVDIQKMMTDLIIVSSEHGAINPTEPPAFLQYVGEIFRSFYALHGIARVMPGKFGEDNKLTALLMLAWAVHDFNNANIKLEQSIAQELIAMQAATPILAEKLREYIANLLNPRLKIFAKMQKKMDKWCRQNGIDLASIKKIPLTSRERAAISAAVESFKESASVKIAAAIKSLLDIITTTPSQQLSLEYKTALGDYVHGAIETIQVIQQPYYLDLLMYPQEKGAVSLLKLEETLSDQLLILQREVTLAIHLLRVDEIPQETPVSIKPSAAEIAAGFAEIAQQERKRQKELEAAQRAERAAVLQQSQKQHERRRLQAEEEKKIKLEQESAKAKVLDSVRVLPKDKQELLLKIFQPGNKLAITYSMLINLLAVINGFVCTEGDKGTLVKFYGKAITTFHRQHGKALHQDVFTAIRVALQDIKISMDELLSIQKEAPRQGAKLSVEK